MGSPTKSSPHMRSWPMNSNVSTVDYNISRFFIQNENMRQSHISLSKMVAVDDGYRRRCHPRPVRPWAAWRGRALEHPISPFGNEHCKRRPGQSGAGRVSPSRRPRPRKPGSSFGRRAPKVQRGPRQHPPYSLKGSVSEPRVCLGSALHGLRRQRRRPTTRSLRA